MPSDTPQKTCTSTEDAPAWLDKTFIQDALRDRGDTNIKVKEISVARATAPGDNYGSIIYRIQVKLANDTTELSLLVKAAPHGEAMTKAIEESGAFQHEMVMLAKHIPAMEELLEQVAPGRFPPLAPRCLSHGSSPVLFLVLEDLKPQEFRLADRYRGLGLCHSLLAIRTLARFHGASVALLSSNPSIANEFPNPFLSAEGSWGSFITSAFQATADVCRNLLELKEYAEKLEKFKSKAIETLLNLSNPRPGKFNVILHGDFWTNNMMFNYHKNGQLQDLRTIDLQMSHVASPAIDIHYFFHTSLSDDVYDNHIALLIREYHTSLTETLGLFGISGPTLQELLADFNEHSFCGLYGAVCVWPIVRAEVVPDMDGIFAGDSSSGTSMHESATRKRMLKRVLPQFKRRGWLHM